ncbi:MAG: rod shape-determining protein [Spirochaetia bacterium]|nr:rod shape-determining protein [Spirochaetia bacterium]
MKEKTGKDLSVGIDLGTSNLLIYVEGQGTVFNEPSIIAIDQATKNVVAVGYEASSLVGKTHDKVKVIRPLQGGVISDIDMIREILIYTFEDIFHSKIDRITKLIICIPSEITETEKDAIIELGHGLGIRNITIDEEIKAAAIGSGIDIYAPQGHLVVDIGGGTTDFGVLSLGDVVLSRSIKTAGDHFDQQIINYVKEAHKLEIGLQTAEKIKIHLASLTGKLPTDEDGKTLLFDAMGRDLVAGLPRQVTISAKEIRELMLRCFENIRSTMIATLESTPPELAGDLVDNGILLSGGGALIPGIKEFFEDITQVPVHISESPLAAVIDGCKKLLKADKKIYLGVM